MSWAQLLGDNAQVLLVLLIQLEHLADCTACLLKSRGCAPGDLNDIHTAATHPRETVHETNCTQQGNKINTMLGEYVRELRATVATARTHIA